LVKKVLELSGKMGGGGEMGLIVKKKPQNTGRRGLLLIGFVNFKAEESSRMEQWKTQKKKRK